jgi:hypothetical protein
MAAVWLPRPLLTMPLRLTEMGKMSVNLTVFAQKRFAKARRSAAFAAGTSEGFTISPDSPGLVDDRN